jgi:hypothetical protein
MHRVSTLKNINALFASQPMGRFCFEPLAFPHVMVNNIINQACHAER